jgi:flavin-dependent dehydrogenase
MTKGLESPNIIFPWLQQVTIVSNICAYAVSDKSSTFGRGCAFRLPHLMPPSGEGANLAMLEGAELASAIVRHLGAIEAALTTSEEPMFSRPATEARDSHDMLERCLGDHAPSAFLDLMTGVTEQDGDRS